MAFRWNTKTVLLTLAQCEGEDLDTVLDLLEAAPTHNVEWVVGSRETHQDGGLHFHILVRLTEKLRSRDALYWDQWLPKHADAKGVRGWKKTLRYVIKDGDFVARNIDPQVALGTTSVAGQVALMLRSGASLDDVDDAHCGFMLRNKRKVEEYAAWQSLRLAKRAKLDWPGWAHPHPEFDSMANRQISGWLNAVINNTMEAGDKHLYIHGSTGLGKSYLVNQLERYVNVYHINRDENFCDDYEDGQYGLAFLDEFHSTKSLGWMNLWLGGFPVRLRIKGSQLMKRVNVPTIICSNYEFDENYPGKTDAERDPLRRRLHIIHVVQPIRILFVPLEHQEEYSRELGG